LEKNLVVKDCIFKRNEPPDTDSFGIGLSCQVSLFRSLILGEKILYVKGILDDQGIPLCRQTIVKDKPEVAFGLLQFVTETTNIFMKDDPLLKKIDPSEG
jgi:hypothetical protein